MVPTVHKEHSSDPDNFNGGWSDQQVLCVIVICTATIAAVVSLVAVAGPYLGVGPHLPAIAYLLLAISAIMILVNYMLTLIPDPFRAGLYMSAFWALAILLILTVLKYFG